MYISAHVHHKFAHARTRTRTQTKILPLATNNILLNAERTLCTYKQNLSFHLNENIPDCISFFDFCHSVKAIFLIKNLFVTKDK